MGFASSYAILKISGSDKRIYLCVVISHLYKVYCVLSLRPNMPVIHASQELCITQSAVSRQIQQLEQFQTLNLGCYSYPGMGVELTLTRTAVLQPDQTLFIGSGQSTLDIMAHKGRSQGER